MKEDCFLNVKIPTDSEDLHGLNDFNEERNRLLEQQDKLNKSEFVLTNRFLVYLTGENINLEPYEVVSFYENLDDVVLGVRLTNKNIISVMNAPKYNNTYQINVEFISPTNETLYEIKYTDCKLSNFMMPQFEYKTSEVATVLMTFKFESKK